jgi:nucleolar complex protein 2
MVNITNNFLRFFQSCYLGFVSNARLVTADTWPLIMLMQQSFADLCMLDPVVAYQYAFVYIRQTGIHLRNAMIAKKKVSIATRLLLLVGQ